MTIESMCLTNFCKTFTVGRGRRNANKITPYSNNCNVVPVFFPRGIQYADVTSENYWQYCMYFLIQ